MRKTFKIGEWAIGGIIKVETRNGMVKISCHDWNSNELIYSTKSNNRTVIYSSLLDWTSIYYADEILAWLDIISDVKLESDNHLSIYAYNNSKGE